MNLMDDHLKLKSDEELMQSYQQGDEKAFDILYKRYSGRIHGYLRSIPLRRDLVDDVFQATFMKLHKSRFHYDPTYPFLPWIFIICKSAMVDYLRMIQRRERHEELNPLAVDLHPSPTPDIPDIPDLSILPEAQKKAIHFRYGEELSFEEIARKIETSEANVRQLVSRGIKKLRNYFLKEEKRREKP